MQILLVQSRLSKLQKVSEKSSFRVGTDLNKVHKQGRDKKALRTLTHYGMMPGPLSGLQHNALHT